MARFIFALEGVLRHRRHLEQERERVLAAAQAEVSRAEVELRALNGSVQNSLQDLRANHLTGRLDLSFLAAHRRYMIASQRQGMALAQRMALAQKQAADARAALIAAARERKMIEKLREKRSMEWRADQARRQQAELDDAGTTLAAAEIFDPTFDPTQGP